MEPQERIRVLIADDSVFIRRYLTALLAGETDVEIVGTASSGDEVVLLAAKLKPDVITMDYNMPGKNGIEAAAAIMLGDRPLPAIIMLSAFEGEHGQELRRTLEASGAEVITKPSGEKSLDIEKIAILVVQKIKETGNIEKNIRMSYEHAHQPHVRVAHVGDIRGELRGVIVIGASTGGPPLVEHLLSLIQPELGISIVIAQHMSKYFTQLFAERLNRVTPYIVREAKSGDTLSPGLALVIPGGFALGAVNETDENGKISTRFVLDQTAQEQHQDEIDRTMKTIAELFGAHAYGVLLSGMGSDGVVGMRAIKEHGGYTIAQDPKTATVSSMPEHAMQEGVIDMVLSAEDIPTHINKLLSGDLKQHPAS